MNLDGPQYLMMIEPKGKGTIPKKDALTKMAEFLWSKTKPKNSYRGWHTCTGQGHEGSGKDEFLKITSDNKDHHFTNKIITDVFKKVGKKIEATDVMTNSLLIHYVACHRKDIPKPELGKLIYYYHVMRDNEVNRIKINKDLEKYVGLRTKPKTMKGMFEEILIGKDDASRNHNIFRKTMWSLGKNS